MPKGERLKGRPRRPGSGRKKGTPNKATTLRATLLEAFNNSSMSVEQLVDKVMQDENQ